MDLTTTARTIIDDNTYMTLGTANENGLPWVSPVWFAPAGYREFFWVSRTERRHSRNLAVRPQLSIVIFDSTVPVATGQAVYMSAVADQPTGAELEAGIRVFSDRSVAQASDPYSLDDVTGAALLRLYRATASEWYVLGEQDERLTVELG